MLTRTRSFALLGLLTLAAPTTAGAARVADPVNVRIQMLESTVDGQYVSRCELEGEVSKGRSKDWCLSYGEVKAHTDAGWEPIRSATRCGSCEGAGGSLAAMRASPYLMLDVSVRPGARGDAPLDVSILSKRLTGFSSDGKAQYKESAEKRVLQARQGEDLVLPLLVTDPKEKDSFGANEVFLRLRARNLAQVPRADYGTISLSSDLPRMEVLLDGGMVGRTTEEGSAVLKNVAAGEREVIIRDPSGRESRKVVRVVKDRNAEVRLGLLPTPPPRHGGLVALGKNSQGQHEYWREKDGAVVVTIPAGVFRMGSPEGEGEPPEHPQHDVDLNEYLIDKMEVTWAQFRRFAEATQTPLPDTPVWGTPNDYPVTSVMWDEAKAFCEWVGGRLPTEAEWEKAARGTDGRKFPWGDEWDDNRCNTRDGGPHRPQDVGAYPDCISPYGVLDMVGSVWEWCEDSYDELSYGNKATKDHEDRQEAPSGSARACRGGSWITPATSTRTAYRQGTDPTWRDVHHGFRCVASSPQGSATATSASSPGPVSSPSPRHFEVGIDIVSNPAGARPSHRCTSSAVIEAGSSKTWWGSVGEVRPRPEGGWEAVGAESLCGPGSPDNTKTSGIPYMILEFTTMPARRSDSLVDTVVTFSWRKFSGFSADGKPSYAGAADPATRVLRLEEWGEGFVPVLVRQDEAEPHSMVRDVLLGIRAKRAPRPQAAAHGVISVASDAPGAQVLLDDGEVARTSEDGVAVLANVRVGERKIALRDSSGRETRRIVDVLEDRTVPLVLYLSKGAVAAPNALVPGADNAKGFREYRRERDGSVMVRVPEGEFLMGNLETEGQPLPHKVYVSTFLIDKTAVTWDQFGRFCQATGRPLPPEPYWGIHGDHPVVYVTWEEARTYCEWVDARLPTEAEREKAARGTDDRKYPWGNEEPSHDLAVFRHNWGYEASGPVESHPAGVSPYGGLNMGGNVWEWCQDWYDPDTYKTSPARDPRGPASGRAHVVRGGSWDSRPSVLSCSCRNWGYLAYREGDFGFRCAADPPQ